MTTGFMRWGGVVMLAALASAGQAQETTETVTSPSGDWSVSQDTDPLLCFSVSAPRESTATRNGEPVEANRSEIQLFVQFSPSTSVTGQLAFTGGYPFAEGSTVKLEVAGEAFELITCTVDGVNKCDENNMPANSVEWAWAGTADQDVQIVDAFKRGSEAVLIGQSARGTVTRDLFSLSGFTLAFTEAQSRCAQQ